MIIAHVVVANGCAGFAELFDNSSHAARYQNLCTAVWTLHIRMQQGVKHNHSAWLWQLHFNNRSKKLKRTLTNLQASVGFIIPQVCQTITTILPSPRQNSHFRHPYCICNSSGSFTASNKVQYQWNWWSCVTECKGSDTPDIPISEMSLDIGLRSTNGNRLVTNAIHTKVLG